MVQPLDRLARLVGLTARPCGLKGLSHLASSTDSAELTGQVPQRSIFLKAEEDAWHSAGRFQNSRPTQHGEAVAVERPSPNGGVSGFAELGEGADEILCRSPGEREYEDRLGWYFLFQKSCDAAY